MLYIIERNDEQTDATLLAIWEAYDLGVNFIVTDQSNPHNHSCEARTFWYCPANDTFLDSDCMSISQYHEQMQLGFELLENF